MARALHADLLWEPGSPGRWSASALAQRVEEDQPGSTGAEEDQEKRQWRSTGSIRGILGRCARQRRCRGSLSRCGVAPVGDGVGVAACVASGVAVAVAVAVGDGLGLGDGWRSATAGSASVLR